MSRPDRVTGLEADPAIARVILTWTSLGFDPLIDHYRIHGVAEPDADFRPSADNLIGKTVYPRYVHQSIAPEGETWTYQVLAVSASGHRGKPSPPLTAESLASVTGTGVEVARIGDFDAKTLEHRFAPAGYAQIPTSYPDAEIDYRQGESTPAEGWPYLLPGPGDAWAGRKVYRARWHLDLDAAPEQDHDLAVWLVDTTRLGGVLQVIVNDTPVADIELPVGSTRGSREGDATVPGSLLLRSYHEPAVPASTLQAGENVIEFVLAEGGWAAWDAVGLFARE